ncbi:MAG TPA: SH3 domain-containing protein [Croceibacterium sp.]|nr:SH3 domain-containing protein [Croceibacterium sp.]
MLRFWSIALLSLVVTASPAAAQNREVPYWAKLRAEEVNMRVGPSEAYPIEWVYRRQGLPVKVLRIMQGWRLVEDPDGERGWIVARLLHPDRAAIVIGDGLADMRAAADDASALRWRVEPGVVGNLGKCEAGWCQLDVEGRKGWVRADRLWGSGEP